MNGTTILDGFAEILSYPTGRYRDALRNLGSALGEDPADTAAKERVENFISATSGHLQEETEELYTRTFDLNPVVSLETGWQLYGETYERGSFMVKMRELLRSCEISESGELPDHLSHLLKALGRVPAGEVRDGLTTALRKSLTKIVANFNDAENPYLDLLHAVTGYLERTAISKEDVQS